MTGAGAGIGAKQVDGAVARRRQQLVNAVQRGEVGLDRSDVAAMAAQIVGGGVDQRFVRDDEKVIAFPRRDMRQFKADAGRCAGDDRKGLHVPPHAEGMLARWSICSCTTSAMAPAVCLSAGVSPSRA